MTERRSEHTKVKIRTSSPTEKIAELEGPLAHRPGPSMDNEAAADVAWHRTIEFFAHHLN